HLSGRHGGTRRRCSASPTILSSSTRPTTAPRRSPGRTAAPRRSARREEYQLGKQLSRAGAGALARPGSPSHRDQRHLLRGRLGADLRFYRGETIDNAGPRRHLRTCMSEPSDHKEAVVEPPTSDHQAAELTSRALRQRIRQQELLAELGVLALQRTSFIGMLDQTARMTAEGLEAEYCKVMEYIPAENRLLVRAGVGWEPR